MKSGWEIRLDDIALVLAENEAYEAISFYNQWRMLGWPYSGGWAEQPARLVEIVEMIDPLDRLYHPRMI